MRELPKSIQNADICCMRTYSFLLTALLYTAGAWGQDGANKTLQSFSKWYAADMPDSIYGLFNPGLKSKLPADTWRASFPQMKGRLGAIGPMLPGATSKMYTNFIAYGSVDSMILTLSLDSAYQVQGIFMAPPKAREGSASHTNYKVQVKDGELAGELTVPPSVKKPPVAVIIAGSGPTDRDGNNVMGVKAQPYKLLAEALQIRGIACIRYDKRFIGGSQGFKQPLDSVRLEDMIDDARAVIRKALADTGFSSVFVIGHSEGALVGCIAAGEEKVSGFVSISGMGEDAPSLLKRQLSAQLPAPLMTQVSSKLDSLQQGHRVAAPVGSPVAPLFAPQVQAYMISWFRIDPVKEIAKLKMPVLIVQGLTDLQVRKEDAELLKKGNPHATLVLIDSMNHVLKNAPLDRAQNIATYSNPLLPLNKVLVERVAAFISDSRLFR